MESAIVQLALMAEGVERVWHCLLVWYYKVLENGVYWGWDCSS